MSGFEISAHPTDGLESRLPTLAQVEHEARIAHRIATEASGGYLTLPKEFFNVV